MNRFRIVGSMLFLLIAQNALGANTMFQFGPTFGSGQNSSDSELRYASGLRLVVDHDLYQNQQWRYAVRGEVQSLQVNSKHAKATGWKETTVHDHRILNVGFKITRTLTDAERRRDIFVAASLGPSTSVLHIDRNQTDSFVQADLAGIQGTFANIELGGQYFVDENFSLNLSAAISRHAINQSKAQGTFSGEVEQNGQLNLVDGSADSASESLPRKLRQNLMTLQLGLAYLL